MYLCLKYWPLYIFQHAGALRKAILSFIVQLDVDELALFFSLLFDPLFSTSRDSQTSDFQFKIFYEGFQPSILRQCSSVLKIDQLSCRKISGFLHVAEDILRTFDEPHLKPFLNMLLIIIVRILECCSSNLINAKGNESSTHVIKTCVSNTASTFNLVWLQNSDIGLVHCHECFSYFSLLSFHILFLK